MKHFVLSLSRERRSTFMFERGERTRQVHKVLSPNYWQVFAKSSAWKSSKILIRIYSLSPRAYYRVFRLKCMLYSCSSLVHVFFFFFAHHSLTSLPSLHIVSKGLIKSYNILKGKEMYHSYTCAGVEVFTSPPRPTAFRRCGI